MNISHEDNASYEDVQVPLLNEVQQEMTPQAMVLYRRRIGSSTDEAFENEASKRYSVCIFLSL